MKEYSTLTQCLASWNGLHIIKGQNSVNTNKPRHDAGGRIGRQRDITLSELFPCAPGGVIRGDMQDAKMAYTELLDENYSL